ncbi:MAG: DNA repair protein RecO [Gammaproteobacteria bacterium]|nr:DNA repair protein RecO [Gammaproteobacteria bacterium]
MTGEPEPGYLLHRRDYRETSFIVEFLTQSGHVRLIARGARRGRNPIAGILQPFSPLALTWRGSSELPTLTLCEPRGNPIGLTGKIMYSGFYLNEITSRLAYRHEIGPDLYPAYENALAGLAAATDIERSLRIYEKRLLAAAGLALLLEQARTGASVEPERAYGYSVDSGPVPAGIDADAPTVSGRTLLALQREEFDDATTRHEAKLLMRHVLRCHIGTKPLASRALFASIRRLP